MQNKIKLLGIIAILVIISGIVFITKQKNSNTANINYSSNQKNVETVTPTTQEISTINSNIPNTTPEVKFYTLAEVSTHNKQSDCWTTINGSVYNLTEWIAEHPGGEGAILGLCGIDGSTAFNTQHGGQKRPASYLDSFKVGELKK